MFRENGRIMQQRRYKTVYQEDLKTFREPEVVTVDNGCISMFSSSEMNDNRIVASRRRNRPTKKVRIPDIINYADEMYEDLYIPIPSCEKGAIGYTFSETGSTGINNGVEFRKKNGSDKFGKQLKLQSRSKVSFDTPLTSLQMSSSSNNSTFQKKPQVITRHNQQTTDNNIHPNQRKQILKVQLMEEHPKENLMKFTSTPSYPRDNYIPPVVADNGEEIYDLVQYEIKQRYSYDSFKEKRTSHVRKKLFVSNTDTGIIRKESYKNERKVKNSEKCTKGKLHGNKWNGIHDDERGNSEDNAASLNSPIENFNFENNNLEEDDVNALMKRKRFSEKDKIQTLDTEVAKSLKTEISVDNSSDESDESICIESPNTYDENFKSHFYRTAIICGEENREEPETVVVATGHVQGMQVREIPREPSRRSLRTYYDYSDEEMDTVQKPISKPPRQRKIRIRRQEV